MNTIQPEEVPAVQGEGFIEETGVLVSLETAATISAEKTIQSPLVQTLRDLNGKNVFVQLKNGSNVKGLLNANLDSGEIRVGFRETNVYFGNIESIIPT